MAVRRLAVLLVVAVLTLAACSDTGTADRSSDPIGTGKFADLRFTATTAAGDTFHGTQLKGKPAVLWFWAPWCPTCRAQSTAVRDLAATYDGKVTVIGVGGLDDAGAVRDYAEQVPGVTHLIDPQGTVWRHFRVTAQSSYEVIDSDGEIIAEGYLDDAALARLVDQLV